MALYFLSDLHLWEENSFLEASLIRLLETLPKEKDMLVFGGDIFDLFISDKKAFQKKFHKILSAIKNLPQRGCKTYFFEGNHDFHLKNVFKGTGVTVFSDAQALSFEGKKIWVSHGDRIHPRDHLYHIFRAFTRSFVGKLIIKVLSGKLLLLIGALMSKKSRDYGEKNKVKCMEVKGIFKDYAEEKIKEGYDYVFLGHSHIEDMVELNVGLHRGTYINLGFSSSKIQYALLENNSVHIQSWDFHTSSS